MNKTDPVIIQKVVELRAAKISFNEIAAQLGITKNQAEHAARLGGSIKERLTTEQTEAIRARRLQGETIESIGVEFGVSRNTIGKITKDLDVSHLKTNTQGLLKDYENGLSYKELASKYTLTPRSINSIITRSGVANRVNRISEEDREKLLQERNKGVTRKELARKYGLSEAGIKQILRREGVVIDPIQRQKNAYEAMLSKNPDAMSHMRKALTPEVIERRSGAVKERYANDEELCKLKGRQSTTWWASQTGPGKYSWNDVIRVANRNGFRVVQLPGHVGQKELKKIKITCSCGLEFDANVYDLLYGKIRSCGCKKTVAQSDIALEIQKRGIELSFNDRSVLPSGKELDIFIPSKRVAIEYCGVHFHGDLFKHPKYHEEKLKEAQGLGIRLITIFSDEWHQRPSSVLAYVLSVLGHQAEQVFGARELLCKKVGISEIKAFLNENHLQGSSGHVGYALFNGEVPLAALTFRRSSDSRKGTPQEGVWELSRFCLKAGVSVRGGFEKMFSHFVKDFSPKKISTFADLRWSIGSVYLKAGFRESGNLPPTYWYTKPGYDTYRVHRSAFRKTKIEQKLGPLIEGETEEAAMKRFGFSRIWDCGYKKFIWTGAV